MIQSMRRVVTMFCILAAAMCAMSCTKDGGKSSLFHKGGNQIGVSVGSSSLVKSSGAQSSGRETLFTFPVETDNGDTLYVTAYVSDMPESTGETSTVTKGAPVTTENITSVFRSFKSTVFDKNGDIYESTDGHEPNGTMESLPVTYDTEDGLWKFPKSYYWPENGDPLTFCSIAPLVPAGTLSGVKWNRGTKLEFSYSLPSPAGPSDDGKYHDAEAQEDLMFALNGGQTINSDVRDGESYANINFSHALTAVQFIRGDLTDCKITTVSLIGFYGSGSAVAEPKESGSKSLKYTWTADGELQTYVQNFDVTLKNVKHQEAGQKVITEGSSLDTTKTKKYTFMMVPQKLDTGAKILIDIAERLHPIELDLTKLGMDAKLTDWSGYAGKLITICVNSVFEGELVDIEMQEDVSVPLEKKDVKVDNLGSLPVYVRAALVANWVKADGAVIYPYQVLAENLGGLDTGKWTYKDGFFYYKYQLPVGGETTFFTRFKSPVPGDPDYPSGVPDVDHLEMTVMFQAVDAKGRDGKTGKEIIAKYGWPSDVFE